MAAPIPNTCSHDPCAGPDPASLPPWLPGDPVALLSTTLEPACCVFSFHTSHSVLSLIPFIQF